MCAMRTLHNVRKWLNWFWRRDAARVRRFVRIHGSKWAAYLGALVYVCVCVCVCDARVLALILVGWLSFRCAFTHATVLHFVSINKWFIVIFAWEGNDCRRPSSSHIAQRRQCVTGPTATTATWCGSSTNELGASVSLCVEYPQCQVQLTALWWMIVSLLSQSIAWFLHLCASGGGRTKLISVAICQVEFGAIWLPSGRALCTFRYSWSRPTNVRRVRFGSGKCRVYPVPNVGIMSCMS